MAFLSTCVYTIAVKYDGSGDGLHLSGLLSQKNGERIKWEVVLWASQKSSFLVAFLFPPFLLHTFSFDDDDNDGNETQADILPLHTHTC